MSKSERKEINVFWAMRFLAFLLVFFFHSSTLNDFIHIPLLAVSFFIIISGFLNGMIYNQKFSRIKAKELIQFTKTKMIKIYPIHLMTFFATIPLTGVFGYNSFIQLYYWIKRAICNVALMQSWINNRDYYFGFNGVSWFLSTFVFLLLITIPCLVLIKKIQEKKHAKTILNIVAVLLFIATMVYIYSIKHLNLSNEYYYLYVFPVARFFEYLIGIVFGVISTTIKEPSKDNRRVLWTIYELLAIIPVVLLIILYPVKLGILDSFISDTINMWIIPIIIVLMVYKYEKGYISKFISNKLFIYLGKISMILFLIHQPIISYFCQNAINKNSMLNKYLASAYLLIITIVLASMINKYLVNRKEKKIVND